MQLIKVYEANVIMDHGQFYLSSRGMYYTDLYTDPVTLITDAQKGEGVAGSGLEILVLCPHQHNFKMPFRVELWDNGPPDDMENWQEVFEAYMTVTGGELVYNNVHDNVVTFSIPDNRYKVLISGRNFVSLGWTESTEPGDSWRVQLWPSQEPASYRRLKKWQYGG